MKFFDWVAHVTLIGQQHNDLADWYSRDWWNDGQATISMLQGFPGSGKTEIADSVEQRIGRDRPNLRVIRCQFSQSCGGNLDDMLLLMAGELAQRGDERLAADPTETTLLAVLIEPILFVIDEFQESFEEQLPHPPEPFMKWIADISGRKTLEGRILFLTSRQLDDERWNERCDKRRLSGLSSADGLAFLSAQLESSDVPDVDFPYERRADVIKWLGGFPRALKLLVGSLHHSPLDELIGTLPETWEGVEQSVSQNLLKIIETEIVSRARKGLPHEIDKFFERLAVYRQPVDNHAISAVSEGMQSYLVWQKELQRRFLLELKQGRYSLHPVLRETVLMPLSDSARKRYHALAGNHYGRHFLGRKMEGMPTKLGVAFIEARYHYTQSGSRAELSKIAHVFERYVRDKMGWTTPVPTHPSECDEGIALLSALLHGGGAKSLHYFLARLLDQRKNPGDLRRALDHAKLGTGSESPFYAWLLRMRLAKRCMGTLWAFNDVHKHGLRILPPERNLFALYLGAEELLIELGQRNSAIKLLNEGIERIGSEHSLYILYSRAAELLVGDSKIGEAIVLLEEGISRVGRALNVSELYVFAADLLDRENRTDEAITLLIKGIALIGSHQSNIVVVELALRYSFAVLDSAALLEIVLLIAPLPDFQIHVKLAEVYRLMLVDRERAKEVMPGLNAIYASSQGMLVYQIAYCWLSLGLPSNAQSVLDDHFSDANSTFRDGTAWLACFIQLELQNQEHADKLLSFHLKRPLRDGEVADRAGLLAMWDRPAGKTGRSPAAEYPVLFPPMTGLQGIVSRNRWQAAVLPNCPAPPAAKVTLPVSDWSAKRFVISLRPKNWSGLYVVGCFDRRITIFTQQARALSLVRALFEVGDLKIGDSVGIVGAGAAGVTAAVAAARLGCEVTLFDEHDAPLSLQAAAQHRYLHPHIYDWPALSSNQSDAGLPLLNWSAGNADCVVEQLRTEFARHQRELGGMLNFSPRSDITSVKTATRKGRIQLLGNEATINQTFDLVMLASGFGVERSADPEASTPSYWSGDGLNGPFSTLQSILISGTGDGGLLDVARASIRSDPNGTHFRHDQAVQILTTDPAFRLLADEMATVDDDAQQAQIRGDMPENLYLAYNALTVPESLLARVRALKRSDTEVTFNYMDESVFTLGSALLNRMLVFLLMKTGVVKKKFGPISSVIPSPLNSSRKRVTFDGSISGALDFDTVVLRHGPPFMEFERRFPNLADDCFELRGKVSELTLTQKLAPDTVDWYLEKLSIPLIAVVPQGIA
jgi:tetratricopeptide (TPR) repeat protein